MDAAVLGLVGLGGLYAIANQEKKTPIQMNSLPEPSGVDKAIVNNNNMNKNSYNTSQQATQIYNDQAEFKKKVRFNVPEPPKNDFTHNNMVPFFGAKIRGRGADLNQAESMLDNMAGAGSQVLKKQEQAPLFRPEDNMQWANGTPNNSDFYQSRMNSGNVMNNVKPWEEEQVGPGLNQGYTTSGSGGFNSGMESRDSWLPKNVNELRVKTNPKVTYDLNNHQGPAKSSINERGHLGNVNKNLPDTYYINSPERYLTTGGIEKGQTSRGIEKLKYQNRYDTTVEYGGAPGNSDKTAPKAPENYSGPKNPHTYGPLLGKAGTAPGVQPSSDSDYGRLGHKVLNNNRNTTDQPSQYGAVGGLIGAVIAPVMDILRPSRKENVIGNIRLSGNVQKVGAGGEYVYDPNDRAKTTIKQMTEDSPFHLNVEKSGAGGEYVYDPNDIAKVTMKQTTECSPFHMNVQNQKGDAYQVSEQQAIYNQRDTTNYCDYSAGGDSSGVALVDNYVRQRNNNNKIQAPASIHGSTNMLNSNINQRNNNIKTINNPRMWVPSGGPTTTPAMQQHGTINGGQVYDNEKIGSDRINPDLLNAFKSNPYTKSLNSVA